MMATIGDLEGLKYMKNNLGADISIPWDKTGQNLFHLGVVFNWLEIVKFAVEMNLDPDLKNIRGNSPRMLAQKDNVNQEIKKMLHLN